MITSTSAPGARLDRLDGVLCATSSLTRRLILVPLTGAADTGALDAWAQHQARSGRLAIATACSGRPGRRTDHADRVMSRLGSERASFYARLSADVRASDIAALLGTLRAGHVAIVALPRASVRRSALLRRLVAGTGHPASAGAGSDVRVIDLAHRAPNRRIATRAVMRPTRRPTTTAPPLSSPGRQHRARAITRASALHDLAVARLHGDPQACVVITGSRGTGKTTRLADLVPVLQALDERGHPPRVVSGGTRGVGTLGVRLPGVRIDAWQSLLNRSEPSAQAHKRAVVIDEAASLPLAVLEKILERYSRVVMATTVEGYEASGRAFEARFLHRLTPLRPTHLVLRASDRFRFEDDAVHRVMQRAFLLDALGGASLDTRAPSDGETIQVERANGSLARSEALIRRTIALLGATHYRTMLDELDPVLDGRLALWLARAADGAVVGLVTLAHEGELPQALHQDVLAGRRRLPDQLLPQLLCRCAGDASALGQRYARITRIAVAPAWRRRGIAARLIDGVRTELSRDVALGASFADTDGVQRLWSRVGMSPLHRGARINPRSGARSVVMLSGGSAVTHRVASRARAVLADNDGSRPDASRDAELLARFARGERGMAETLGPLGRAWQHWTGDSGAAVQQAAERLGLPVETAGRRLERALADWVRTHLSVIPSPAIPTRLPDREAHDR